MDGLVSAAFFKKLSAPTEGGVNLKRQEEIKHKMNGFEARWEGIETANATWWQETSKNLKDKFRPEVLEKLKDLPLFSSNLPPLDTKFDPHNIDTKGIVLTKEEKEVVEDKIKRFDRAVGQSNKWWGEIQNDIRDMKLSPQETDELRKTESSLLLTDKLPPSRYKAKENYKLEQERKKSEEERIRKEREKKDFSLKINEALGANNPQFASLTTSPPPPSDFSKHFAPHTSFKEIDLKDIPNGDINNPSKVTFPPETPPSSPTTAPPTTLPPTPPNFSPPVPPKMN